MKLSIIIINFNVKYFLEQCLCSVSKATKNIEVEILVVDNNSTDGSKEFFSGRFQNVHFTWNTVNTGFSKANNLAIKQARGEFILFLNPDTILPEDCLEKCLAYFNHRDDAGAIGIRMIDGSGNYLKESKRGFPTPFTSLCKLSGLTALFPYSRIFAQYYLGHLDQYKNHEVDVLAGAFMMVKKKVLDKTGGFDEQFFMYGEDIDLSYRIQKAGFKNFYFSECTILHFKGESTNRGNSKYVRLFYGAMSLFVKKHYSKDSATLYNLLINVAIPIKVLFLGITNRLNKLFTSIDLTYDGSPCIIVGDKKTFEYIVSLLKKNNLKQNIIGRINSGQSMREDAVGNLQQLPSLVIRRKVKELIFCLNGLSTKEMIDLVGQLPADVFFRFHFEGSVSIVGSRHKESSGECIA